MNVCILATFGLHGVLSQVGKIETPSGPFGTYTGQIQFGSP
jgi:hypothetical protein